MIRTTNFKIYTDKINYSKLKENHVLVRYKIPDEFRRYAKYKDKWNAYAKFENYYKEVLERPCYHFRPKNAPIHYIYVLYDKKDTISKITFKLNTPEDEIFEFQLIPSTIDFDSPELKSHVLIKVLLADFFYRQHVTHRICQHYFYLFGRNEVNTKGEALGFSRGVYIRQ